MTIDDYVIIPFYNIDIRLWIFDIFYPKLNHNQYNDNSITHKLNYAIDYKICKKKKILVVWNRQTIQIKQKKKKIPRTVNCPASSEKVIAYANKTTHPQFIQLNYSIGYMLLIS